MQRRNSCTRSTSCCDILHVPSPFLGALGRNSRMVFFTRKFHETSVTRSLMGGNARIGSSVTGCSGGKESKRVMHVRRELPLLSAEQEPHLPALQFQRTARSLACSAWIRCTASRTT